MAQKAPVMVPSDMSVEDVADRARGPRRAEVDDLIAMHQQITGEESRVWAGRIIGFGEYEYRYPSGHGGTAPLLAFAPGPSNHTIYLVSGFAERWPELLAALGPHRASKACLYITRLEKVDREALRELLEQSLRVTMQEAERP